jgi:hypothetical protein
VIYQSQPPTILIGETTRAIAAAKRLGVEALGRFEEYVRRLEQFAKLPFPRKEPWGDGAALTWEAAAQCQQLVTSTRIWAHVNQDALRVALTKVGRGDLLPPDEGDDQPRNTLLELTTGALLDKQGFTVDLTIGDEDVIATAPGVAPFSIECKRPGSAKAVLRNLKDAKSQLETRYRNGRRHGIAVLGVDRSLGLTEGGFVARDSQHIATVVHSKLGSLRNELRRAMVDPKTPQYQLFPQTPLFGLVLVGSVFNLSDGVPVGIQQFSLSCSGPEEHEISKSLLATVASLFNQLRV